MGYTHYFKQNTPVDIDTWREITAEVRRLIDASPVTICNGSGDVGSTAVIDDNSIAFNGENDENSAIDDSHETFMLPRDYREFNFCKTARKPYDLLVTASLIVANHFAPDAYDIGSDGDQSDWFDGLEYARNTLGNYSLQIPSRVRD